MFRNFVHFAKQVVGLEPVPDHPIVERIRRDNAEIDANVAAIMAQYDAHSLALLDQHGPQATVLAPAPLAVASPDFLVN